MSALYYESTPNQNAAINKELNTTEKEVEDIINLIKAWIKQQPHLPQEEGSLFDNKLKTMLKCNKMSVEKTKQKIDMNYTVRNVFPEYFQNTEPLQPRMQKARETFILLPLPKPFDDLSRVHFFRLHDTDVEKFLMDDFTALSVYMLNTRAFFDLCIGEIYIYDLCNVTLSHITRINLSLIKKLNTIFEKAYSDRIVAMHFLNLPSYGEILINLMKTVMKEKIANRIHIHSDLESLHKKVPKNILPADYGGEEKPLLEIRKNWNKYLEDNNSWFIKQSSYRPNEKLRPGKVIANELFGIDGSFRTLDID